MSEHVVNNNPKKEFLFALGGVGLFLGIVLLIGISAFLRPAGEHITAEPTAESVAADEAAVIAAEPAVAAAPVAAAPAADATPADAGVGAGEIAAGTDTPADATTTPAPGTGDAVVATGSATATADGTVNQAAVQETELVGPSDQVEGTVNPPVAAK